MYSYKWSRSTVADLSIVASILSVFIYKMLAIIQVLVIICETTIISWVHWITEVFKKLKHILIVFIHCRNYSINLFTFVWHCNSCIDVRSLKNMDLMSQCLFFLTIYNNFSQFVFVDMIYSTFLCCLLYCTGLKCRNLQYCPLSTVCIHCRSVKAHSVTARVPI